MGRRTSGQVSNHVKPGGTTSEMANNEQNNVINITENKVLIVADMPTKNDLSKQRSIHLSHFFRKNCCC